MCDGGTILCQWEARTHGPWKSVSIVCSPWWTALKGTLKAGPLEDTGRAKLQLTVVVVNLITHPLLASLLLSFHTPWPTHLLPGKTLPNEVWAANLCFGLSL